MRWPRPAGAAPAAIANLRHVSGQRRGDAGPALTIAGFVFGTPRGGSLMIVPGAKAGQMALLLTPAGIVVLFPFAAARIIATVVYFGGKPLQIICEDANGSPVGHATSGPQQGVVQTLEVTSSAMVRARFVGQEGRLISICLERDTKAVLRVVDDRQRGETGHVDPKAKLDTALRSALDRLGD